MTLDDDLARAVDRLVSRLKTSRSAFTREASHEALRRAQVREQGAATVPALHGQPCGRAPQALWPRL